ncbi:MAG: hypothetical protein CFE39_03020 [Comamonadaceae bacterium PBBC2]|nr:MAG: hypothetical protein CFE39_03020 [Comamonadaceae bacterium PBBC2]
MNRNKTTAKKSALIWQRHALAQACFMVAAGISTTAYAVDYTPGAAMIAVDASLDPLAAGYGQNWSTGYNIQSPIYQFGAGQVDGVMGTNTYFSSSLTGGGVLPVNITNNSLLVYSYGNQNTVTNLSLGNLARVSSSNDGILALNLQIFSALALTDEEEVPYYSTKSVLAAVSDTSTYIEQATKGAANLNLSGMTVAATLALNTVSTSLSGATPFGYSSTTKGASAVAFGDSNSSGSLDDTGHPELSVRGTKGSVNISNLQTAFNAYGTANVSDSSAKITVSDTANVGSNPGVLSSNISLNSNTVKASNTNNEAVSIVNATASSSAFTGSVSVTNIQATKNTEGNIQLANVVNGNVQADLRNDGGVAGKTELTGNLSVNDNAVVAQSMGNTAGSRTSVGGIAAGNAIVFDGSTDITGVTAPLAVGSTGYSASIDRSAGTVNVNADLLTNNVQRNTGNTFTATIDTSLITSNMDMLNGGTVNQNGNSQTATATGNLAGNLITAGASASISNIVANAAAVNTQLNKTTTLTASVTDSAQTVNIGITSPPTTLNGTVNLNDNAITATAEGNVAANTLRLRASNLTVGGNGAPLVKLVPADADVGTELTASAGTAATVLNAQSNIGLTLTSNNEGNSLGVSFNTQTAGADKLAINASQVNVNSNSVLSTATGNTASNAMTLTATNAPGLNAGLGNAQFMGTSSDITANAGFATPLTVSIDALTVSASQLSMNSNALSATARGNSASNSLTVTATNASGLSSSNTSGPFYDAEAKPFSKSSDVNTGSDGAVGVQSNADFALANAQADNGSTIGAVFSGSSKITTTTVGTSSTLSANNNSLTASAGVNSASNALTANMGNMTGMVMGLSSGQSALDSAASATNTAEVSINTGAVSGASNLNLNQNTVTASAFGNAVTNSLNLNSTTASGRDLNKDPSDPTINMAGASIGSGVASVTSDFALSNSQNLNSSSDFNAAVTSGTKVIAGAVTSSAVTVNGNNTLASATGNNATNDMVLAVTTLTKPNTGLASSQSLMGASFTATVSDASITVGTGVVAGAASGAQIAVTGNLTQASALGNLATNSISISGTSITGSDVNFDAPVTQTGVFGGVVSSPSSVALVSLQKSEGNSMSAEVGSSGTLSKIGLSTSAVSNASTLSLTDNTLSTKVYNNSATNSIELTETNINNLSVGLASGQAISAAFINPGYSPLTGSTGGQIKISSPGSLQGGSALTVSGNTIQSLVLGNAGSNSLSLTATNASGRNSSSEGYVQAEGKAHSSSADFSLVSEQQIYSSDVSATSYGNIQATSVAVTSSALTLSQNTFSAYASANNVGNQLDLATTNLSQSTAGLANMQSLNNEVKVQATVNEPLVKINATSLSASTVTQSNNTLKATALGNVATNELNLTGTNATAGTASLNASNANAQDYASANAALALANYQGSNDTLVAATIGNSAIYTTLGAAVGSASSLTVAANSVAALGYVNNATNSMAVSVTNLNGMTAAVASGQFAEAYSEKSTAETAGSITANTGNVSGASTVTVGGATAAAGNAMTASSNVNYAANTLLVTGSQITGRDAVSPFATSSASTWIAQVGADYSVANHQVMAGGGNDFARATVSGLIGADLGSVTSSTVNVSNNTISAYVSGNNAANGLGITATGMTTASAGVASQQLVNSSNVKSDTTAEVSVSAIGLTSANVSLNNNNLKSTAVANSVANTLAATVSSVSGANTNFDAFAGLGNADYPTSNLNADLMINNTQTAVGTTVQAQTGVIGGTAATVFQYLDGISSASQVSMNSNALTSSAYANSANNAMVVRSTDVAAMTMGNANTQVVSAAMVTANTNGEVKRDNLAIGDSTASMNSNQVASTALANIASNSLSVTATNVSGRSNNPYVNTDDREQGADLTLFNGQTMTGTGTVAKTNGNLQTFTNGESVQNSQLSVNSNSVTSYASGNQASNEMTLAVTHLSAASAGVASIQNMVSNSYADAMTTGNVLINGNTIINSAVSLNNNQVKSTALGNLATNQLTLSGTSAQSDTSISTPVDKNNTSADVSLTNKQYTNYGISATATTRANASSPTDPLEIQMTVGAVNSGAALSVNSNTLSATSYLNSASNTLDLGVTNLTAMNAAVNNWQYARGNIDANNHPNQSVSTVMGKISLDVADSVDTASLAVNNNLISSTAYANSVNNSLTVTGTTVSGRGVSSRSNKADINDGAMLTTDYALGNVQEIANGAALATTTGNVNLNASSMAVDAGTLSLNTNNVLAYASGSFATNNLALAVTTLSNASAGVASTQVAGSYLPQVEATVTGGVNLTTGDLGMNASSNLTAKDNNIKATALGNVMGNALTISASTITTTGSGNVLSEGRNGFAASNADFSITTEQEMMGPVTATATGKLAITTGLVNDSTLTLTGNSLKSLAQGNSVSNDLTINAAQQNRVTASVVSYQGDSDGGSGVTASTSASGAALSVSTAGLSNATVAITGNTISAVAGKNEVYNTLTVRGSNILGRNDDVSGLEAGVPATTNVDFSVVNTQTARTSVSASVDIGASGFVSTGVFSGGTVSLSDNTILASANANTVSNSLTLAAINRLEASGAINSFQTLTSSAAISATVSGALSVETDASSGNANVAVSNNVVKASASANLASSALNATASNGISTAGAVTQPTGSTATPTFAVLNSQNTERGTSVTASINSFTMGGVQLGGALNSGGTAGVTGNLMQATAYGNSASNSVQVSALPATLNTASASITNVQYNLASVSASVNNASVQAGGISSTTSAGVNISGNSTIAMAVGNRASNVIVGR